MTASCVPLMSPLAFVDELPEAITPPTPMEIAKALQRIQEREIQRQTFHDTLVDAQTGQAVHVPGASSSCVCGGVELGRE